MSDITLNTQSITGNHNFVPPGTDWNLGSGSKKWNGGYFGTIIADNGIPAGTAATGGDKIGQIRFSINPNIEPGYLALNGQEVNRDDYPNLWEWVQQQVGFLVEEGEWQSISTAHNGNVGKYSVGNGSTTFRLPNLGCWVRGGGTAGTAAGVGGNLDAGLPNIEGYAQIPRDVDSENGALYFSNIDGAWASAGTGKHNWGRLNIDASRSSSIYGNAETVQPESIVGIWLVKAYHVPVDNMGNTITVNGVSPDENGNITIEVPQPTIATEAEAEAGTDNTKFMTPLRTKQAINVLMNAIPVGTILPFAGNSIPSGFLACNGAAVSRTTYAALFSAIGTTYGSGNGSSTFNLPNVESNKFLQGNSTPGTVKTAGLPNIKGVAYAASGYGFFRKDSGGNRSGAFIKGAAANNLEGGGYSNISTNYLGFDASASNSIYGASNTVQPPAVTVRFIIKY